MTAGGLVLPAVLTRSLTMVVIDFLTPYATATEESSPWRLVMTDPKARSSQAQANGSGREYDVGYRKPPKHKQFKPGQSGYPRGRPKGAKNEATILRELLDHKKLQVRERGRTRAVTVREAILLRVIEDALKGNTKSAAFILNRYGLIVSGEIQETELTGDDQAVLKAFMARLKSDP
jgi:hypothetical protein